MSVWRACVYACVFSVKQVLRTRVPDLSNLNDIGEVVGAGGPCILCGCGLSALPFRTDPFSLSLSLSLSHTHTHTHTHTLSRSLALILSHTQSHSSFALLCLLCWSATAVGYGSESEMEEEASKVELPDRHGRTRAGQSAVKLTDLGPRMTLKLVKIESGLASGDVLYHAFGTCVDRSPLLPQLLASHPSLSLLF